MIEKLRNCRKVVNEDGREILPSEAVLEIAKGWHGAFVTMHEWWGPQAFVLTVSNDLRPGNILQMALETLKEEPEEVYTFKEVTRKDLGFEDIEAVCDEITMDLDFDFISSQMKEGEEYYVDEIHVLVPSRMKYPIFPRLSEEVTSFVLALDDLWWEQAVKEAEAQQLRLHVEGNALYARRVIKA